MTNLEIIEKFLMPRPSKVLSENTKKQYRRELKKIFKTMNNIHYSEIMIGDLQSYTGYLSVRYDDNNSSFNTALVCLRSFIKWLSVYEYNTKINLDLFLKEFGTRETEGELGKGDKPLPIEEYIAFNNYVLSKPTNSFLTQRQKVVTLLASTLGLRCIEIAGLKKNDINFESLYVEPSVTKGGKKRIIKLPLDQRVAKEIQKLYELEPFHINYVITTKNGTPIETNAVNSIINGEPVYIKEKDENGKMIDKIFEKEIVNPFTFKIEIKKYKVVDELASKGIVGEAIRRGFISFKVLPHGLRKSCAVFMRHQLKKPIEYIRDFLGHKTATTTEIYTQLPEKFVDEQTMDLFSIDN